MKLIDRLVALVGLAIIFLLGVALASSHAQVAQTGAASVTNSSGDKAAAQAVATLPAQQNQFTWICGFVVSGLGATGASNIQIAVTGLAAGSTSFALNVPAGVTTALPLTQFTFSPCLQGSAWNTAVVVTVPSLGTGNTHAQVTAWGVQF